MPRHACRALKVNDLASSLTFYVQRLGFPLAESQPDADRALVLDPYGDPILLAGPAVEDVSVHLDEPRIVHKPGDTLDFAQENLDVRRATLTARGLTDIHQEQTDEGDRKLIIKDPSNCSWIIASCISSSYDKARRKSGGRAVSPASVI